MAPRRLVVAVVYVALYVALDWISYIQPVLKLGITPWSPQTGLTLAFLLWYGPWGAPFTGAAALLAELLVRSAPANLWLLAMASLWIAGSYAVLALALGPSLVRNAMRGLTPALRFVFACFAASLVAAIGYVGTFVLGHSLPPASAAGSVVRYWVGDINGILMLTPLLLALPDSGAALKAIRSGLREALIQIAIVVLFVWLLFGLDASDRLRFFYPLFVPVIWIAVRWGASGALTAALAIQIGIIITMRDAPMGAPLIDLQILMLTLTLTGLLLGAVVAERAQALRQVAAGEAELRAVLAAAPDAVITADPDGVVRTGNQAAAELFLLPSTETSLPLQHLLPDLKPGLTSGRRTLQARRVDDSRFHADVAWVRIEPPARPGWLLMVRDATGRMKAQSEAQERDRALARAMRFAVAGELASALAHELNQPITALVSYLQASQIMAVPAVAMDERLTDTLSKATNEAIRASQVMRRLRDFYQGAAPGTGPTDAAACCASIMELLDPRAQKQKTRLHLELDADLPPVRADRSQVEMVLHNLVTNAIDALAGSEASTREAIIHGRSHGSCVVLGVHDAGPGIAPDALAQLFEPFNTTKPDGMGLGLAISRNLMRAQGGDILYHRSGKLGGACFEVHIPVFTTPGA